MGAGVYQTAMCHNAIVRVVLISTYEMGRQPFGLASPAAWLRREGAEVAVFDLSRQRLDEPAMAAASVVAFYLPMHTATRLALPVIDRVRALAPAARLCAFGLYAPPNADLLRRKGIAAMFGAEFEADLVAFATNSQAEEALAQPAAPADVSARAGAPAAKAAVARLAFIAPDRAGLPPPQLYATLQDGGTRRVVGYTEASRGCKHRCRHCPVVPVYDGQFRIVPADIVVSDIAAQVERGVEHVTFGDPDFFNGPAHALHVVDAVHDRFPTLTYDVTIKVEHLLRHADLLPRLVDTGCRFVTSAVEAVDNVVLARLDKGHTAADVERAVEVCAGIGLPLAPTFVPFTPWTTLDGYLELLRTVQRLRLVDAVAPIQYAIRLLVSEGSLLLRLPDVQARLRPFDAAALMYPWVHADPRVDALQREIQWLVGRGMTADRAGVFGQVQALAAEMTGRVVPAPLVAPDADFRRTAVPYLNEPWYC
jgi:hypothetical protein